MQTQGPRRIKSCVSSHLFPEYFRESEIGAKLAYLSIADACLGSLKGIKKNKLGTGRTSYSMLNAMMPQHQRKFFVWFITHLLE